MKTGSVTDLTFLEELSLSLPADGLVPDTILIQRNSNSVTMNAETVGAEVIFEARWSACFKFRCPPGFDLGKPSPAFRPPPVRVLPGKWNTSIVRFLIALHPAILPLAERDVLLRLSQNCQPYLRIS